MFKISHTTLLEVVSVLKKYAINGISPHMCSLNIITDIKNNQIMFYASTGDVNVSYIYSTAIDSNDDYSISIPMQAILSIMPIIKDPDTIYCFNLINADQCDLTFDKYNTKYQLKIKQFDHSVCDVPKWNIDNTSKYFKLPIDGLILYLPLILSSISKDKYKVPLTDVFFHCRHDFIEIASTNGHYLNVFKEQLFPHTSLSNHELNNQYEFIMPHKFFSHICSVLKSNKKSLTEIEFIYNNDSIVVKIGSLVFNSKLITGCTSPDYNRIIPVMDDYICYTFDKTELVNKLSIIKSLHGKVNSNTNQSPVLDITFESNIMTFDYINKDGTTITDSFDCLIDHKHVDYDHKIMIKINPIYLLNLLQPNPFAIINILINQTDPLSAIMIKNNFTDNIQSMLMPVR